MPSQFGQYTLPTSMDFSSHLGRAARAQASPHARLSERYSSNKFSCRLSAIKLALVLLYPHLAILVCPYKIYLHCPEIVSSNIEGNAYFWKGKEALLSGGIFNEQLMFKFWDGLDMKTYFNSELGLEKIWTDFIHCLRQKLSAINWLWSLKLV